MSVIRYIKQKFISIFSLLLCVHTVNAQQFYASTEYGLALGAAHYFGDLNPNYGLQKPMAAGGVFIRQHLNPYISVRGSLNYTYLEYADALSKNAYQKERNLSFSSNILEAALVAEFNFFWFSTGDPRHRFTPYLMGGLGVFYFEPMAKYAGRNYKLRLLGTEGQNTNIEEYKKRKYTPFSLCFPVGAGFKYWASPGVNIGFEVANRLTLTDYLDDVSTTYVGADKFINNPMYPTAASQLQDRSLAIDGNKLGREGKQRGDSHTKDQYFMAQITLSIQLKTYKCPSHLDGVWEP